MGKHAHKSLREKVAQSIEELEQLFRQELARLRAERDEARADRDEAVMWLRKYRDIKPPRGRPASDFLEKIDAKQNEEHERKRS